MYRGYIFIVGSGRSGTTLLVRCLNRADTISIVNQTHFMGHLVRPGLRQEIAKFGDLTDDNVVREVIDYLYSSPYRGGGYWRWLLKNVNKEWLTQKVLDSDRSQRSLFTILMELPSNGKPVLGEKTPGHLYHVPILLEWFPTAKIVHMFRDPRAIYVSETRYRLNQRGSKLFPYKQIRQLGLKRILIPLYTIFHTWRVWSRAIELHWQYEKDFSDNYYLVKFEDLVRAPENELRKLCHFLEVEFQEQMLDQVVVNTSFASEAGKAGFDKEAADRWKKYINPIANVTFSLVWRRRLREIGYIT